VAARTGRIQADELRDDTPLVSRGLLSSLHVLELILFIEQLSERAVDAGRLRPGAFRDIDSICRTFFPEDLP
jgi:hypothetical protein